MQQSMTEYFILPIFLEVQDVRFPHPRARALVAGASEELVRREPPHLGLFLRALPRLLDRDSAMDYAD